MAAPVTDSLVPFPWFLVPVVIAAVSLALLLVFAVWTSRTAKWFLYWSDSRGLRKPEGRLKALLTRRAKQRAARPAQGAGAAPLQPESAAPEFLKARARQRLQDKAGIAPRRTIAERLAALTGRGEEPPLAPALPEEALRRLETRAQAVLGTAAPPREERRRGFGDAMNQSQQMTDSMLRSLEEQAKRGLITPQTLEELRGRIVAKRGAGGQRS